MDLVIHRRAEKILRRMQPKTAAAIIAALERIAQDPFARHRNVKRLVGADDAFRLRHGDWRALYRLDRATGAMIVEIIGSRGDVYR